MLAHTQPCDNCGDRFNEDDLEYFEERNEYLCQDCAYSLTQEELEEDYEPQQHSQSRTLA